MVSIELREGITETLDILNHMEKQYIDKIPEKFKAFLENNKSDSYIPNLDHTKKINEMNLKEKTKDILAIIYMNYWCTPEKKQQYKKLLNDNEKKYQEELRKKYNPEMIFKKKQKITVQEETSLIQSKESWIKKFINKIKKYFLSK